MKRIWLDRVLIGVLLGVASFFGSVLIEKYKATQAESQFFLDKRLQAATEVRKALTGVTESLFQLTQSPCLVVPFNEADKVALRDATTALVSVLNTNSLLFDEAYLEEANRVVNAIAGAGAEPKILTCAMRPFFAGLADYLTHQTRRQVSSATYKPWGGFVPLSRSPSELDELGTSGYLLLNFNEWSRTATQPSRAASQSRR